MSRQQDSKQARRITAPNQTHLSIWLTNYNCFMPLLCFQTGNFETLGPKSEAPAASARRQTAVDGYARRGEQANLAAQLDEARAHAAQSITAVLAENQRSSCDRALGPSSHRTSRLHPASRSSRRLD